jgi:hypothetical protein
MEVAQVEEQMRSGEEGEEGEEEEDEDEEESAASVPRFCPPPSLFLLFFFFFLSCPKPPATLAAAAQGPHLRASFFLNCDFEKWDLSSSRSQPEQGNVAGRGGSAEVISAYVHM